MTSRAATMSSRAIAAGIRRDVIEESHRAHVGHVGSSLSIADVLGVLFAGRHATVDPTDPDRDRFVLSKGHAALGLYAALHRCGRISRAELQTFGTNGSELVGHPEHTMAHVDFSTGSLGQGLSVAAGAALAAKIQGSARRVDVLLSDAECDEGSVWEAAMFAAQHRLGNLTAIIDANGQQAFGYTHEVLALEPLSDRWQAFGWEVHDLDGHDHDALSDVIDAEPTDDRPRMVIARSTFGKGVSFMESRIEWHYLPMSEPQYRQALVEVG